jgi:tetratricopeptide (TPR) repeat protein
MATWGFRLQGRKLVKAFVATLLLSGTVMSAKALWQARSTAGDGCPASANVRSVLSKSAGFFANAQYEEAIAALQSLAHLDCDARVSILLAAALEGKGDASAANTVLQHAHTVWVENNSISTSLARQYLRMGDPDKASQSLENFHPDMNTPSQELEVGTVVFLATHQLVRARTIAQINYSVHPSLRTLLLLANSLQLEGRYKEVVLLLQEKRGTYKQSAAFLITLAESESDEKIYDAARADLVSAIVIDPRLYQGHYLLGNVLNNLGEVDQAVVEYRQAITLAPDQPRTYFALAMALRAKQDEAGEKEALERTLALNPHYAMAHSEMGRILMNLGLFADAIAQLNLAVVDNPSAEQPYYLLSRAYDRVGKTNDSLEAAKRLESIRSANHRQAQNSTRSEGNTGSSTTP